MLYYFVKVSKNAKVNLHCIKTLNNVLLEMYDCRQVFKGRGYKITLVQYKNANQQQEKQTVRKVINGGSQGNPDEHI